MVSLHWGNIRVPVTAAWSAEEGLQTVGDCPWAKVPALMQPEAQGQGKPVFGTPHSQRQRRAVINCLCDLCGRSLTSATKVSLSHARVSLTGALGPCVMQVEPLLHATCAAVAVEQCPSLKRDAEGGTLNIRVVWKWRAQIALLTPEAVVEFTGKPYPFSVAGHAKVELVKWSDRDLGWLRGRA